MRKRNIYFSLFLCAFAYLCTAISSAMAQSLSSYCIMADTICYNSIAATGHRLVFSELDDGSAAFTMPFSMPFGTSTIALGSTVTVTSNGYICIGGNSYTSGPSYPTSGTSFVINPLINEDAYLDRYTESGAFYKTENGKLIIEYVGLGRYASPYGYMSYQVSLSSDGVIDIVYDSVNVSTTTALKGVLRDGTTGSTVYFGGDWALPTISTTPQSLPSNIMPERGLHYKIQPTGYAYRGFETTCPSGQKLNFYITTSSTVEVWGNPSGQLIIPSSVGYNGTSYSVVGIYNDYEDGGFGFENDDALISVVLPNTITSIGSSAFAGCINLSSINIPNNVAIINDGAFWGCSSLTSVTIPNSVTAIGISAFDGCSSLTSITIPNSVTFVGEYAFKDCSNLTSVIFNATNCTWMGSRHYPTFSGCSNLSTLTIGEGVTIIPDYAFVYCSSLEIITVEANIVPTMGNNVFSSVSTSIPVYVPCGTVSAYQESNVWGQFSNIQENQSCLPHYDLFYEFYGSTATVFGSSHWGSRVPIANYGTLEELEIPNTVTYNGNTYSVTSIGHGAFEDCSGITSVTIPESVTSIGDQAFSNCIGLSSVSIPNTVTTIGSYAFQHCSGLTSVTIPSSVTSIGNSAFSGCSGLESIIVDVRNAYYDSRNDCNAIIETSSNALINGCRTTTIPESVAIIGERAFSDCIGLASVTIPNTVTTIGSYAFQHCSGLTSVTIPSSVTSIGNSAFSSCSGLESIIVDGGNAYYDSRNDCNAIIETSSNALINGCRTTTIPESVATIGDRAFSDCIGLTSVTIPNTVTSIGIDAFNNCTSLTSIALPESVTDISSGAFRNCSELKEVNLSEYLTSIPNLAFQNCTSLMSFIIPNSVRGIGGYAFAGCSSLKSIVIGSSLTGFDWEPFHDCSELKTVYILSDFVLGVNDYGLSAKRVVPCMSTGSGENTLYKIFENHFSVVDQEENDCSANQIPKSDLPNNFIYSNDGGATWRANNIVLTDCKNSFWVPNDFTADHVTYARTFANNNRSTLYLPFTAAKSNCDGLEVYEFTNYSNGTLSFRPLEGDYVAAYTPYLVGYGLTKDGSNTCSIEQDNAVFPATVEDAGAVIKGDMTFHGTWKRTNDLPTNCYGYKDGYFVQSGGHAHVNPFRCFFTDNSGSNLNSLGVDITDGDYLGIDEVDGDMEQSSIRYSNDVYDMMGRLVRKDAESLRGLPKGIYIWRGKKQIAF